MTDLIKAKIIALVPDITAGCYAHNPTLQTHTDIPADVECDCDITLAIVLRAIGNGSDLSEYDIARDALTTRRFRPYERVVRWNLEHDNYDAQSQETKDFIGILLNVWTTLTAARSAKEPSGLLSHVFARAITAQTKNNKPTVLRLETNLPLPIQRMKLMQKRWHENSQRIRQ